MNLITLSVVVMFLISFQSYRKHKVDIFLPFLMQSSISCSLENHKMENWRRVERENNK
jgi:hypothetical protein